MTPERFSIYVSDEDPRTLHEWMRDAVNANMPKQGDATNRDMAEQLFDLLMDENADVLRRFGNSRTIDVIQEMISGTLRKQHSKYHADMRKVHWALSAKSATETGDATVYSEARIRAFDLRFAVDTKHTQRRVGDMNATDLRFVARRCERSGTFELLKAAFFYKVAQLCGPDGLVEEVMSEEQYNRLYDTYVAGKEPEPPEAATAATN